MRHGPMGVCSARRNAAVVRATAGVNKSPSAALLARFSLFLQGVATWRRCARIPQRVFGHIEPPKHLFLICLVLILGLEAVN